MRSLDHLNSIEQEKFTYPFAYIIIMQTQLTNEIEVNAFSVFGKPIYLFDDFSGDSFCQNGFHRERIVSDNGLIIDEQMGLGSATFSKIYGLVVQECFQIFILGADERINQTLGVWNLRQWDQRKSA